MTKMPAGTDAKEEVEDLHQFVEAMQQENRKWRRISISLGGLSVLLGVLSVLMSTAIL